MSSTIGVGIEVNVSGFDPSGALFTWNATYGKFLSWGLPDYKVNEQGTLVTNNGEKLYWSFIEKPGSTPDPVIITVTARDPAKGRILGSTTMILEWEEGLWVRVKETR